MTSTVGGLEEIAAGTVPRRGNPRISQAACFSIRRRRSEESGSHLRFRLTALRSCA